MENKHGVKIFIALRTYLANEYDIDWVLLLYRALPDITSIPKVRQIFKIRTVRKPDISFPDAGLLTLLKIDKKKIQKIEKKSDKEVNWDYLLPIFPQSFHK